jgi:membrane-bound lytic murein transglycosylase
MADQPTHWYRAVDRQYANYDPFAEFEQPSGSHTKIEVWEIEVLHLTPKGAKVRDPLTGEPRQVMRGARKAFARPTEKEALHDLFYRKRRQMEIYTARAASARKAMLKVEKMLNVKVGT